MVKSYIARHHEAGKMILKASLRGTSVYDDKFMAKIQQQHKSLCQILKKEGHGVDRFPNILGLQGSVFSSLRFLQSSHSWIYQCKNTCDTVLINSAAILQSEFLGMQLLKKL